MSTLFEQPSSNNFNINNRGGGIKRMKKSEGPTNFYQQIEFNAERLLLNFPSKEKLQLMKLLESVDNEIEVANEILNQEINYNSINNNNNSNINSAFKNQSDYEMSQQNQYNNNQMNQNKLQYQMNMDKQTPLKERKILTNLKLKQVKNDRLNGQNLIQKNQQNTNISEVSNSNTMMSQNCIQIEENMNDRSILSSLKQQISYGMPNSSEQLESKISQEISNNLDDQQKQLKNNINRINNDQNQDSNDDDDQQSATQDDDSQPQQQQIQLNMRQQQNSSLQQQQQQRQQQSVRINSNQGIQPQQHQQQQQQGVNNPRLKDINQISQFQKSLVDEIIPQLLQKLGNSDIQQAPDILMQAFKYYEEQNRKAIQYDKIIQNHEILLRGFNNIYNKNVTLSKENVDLKNKNEEIKQESEKYRNISERLAIMFNNNNEQQPSFHHVNYFDKGGSSGMCF